MNHLKYIPSGHGVQRNIALAAAGTDFSEVLLVAPFDCVVEELAVIMAAAVAASGTLTETFTIDSRLTTGAIKTAAIAVRNTATVGFVAFANTALVIAKPGEKLLKGEMLTVTKTHLSTGTAIPSSVWRVGHSGSR